MNIYDLLARRAVGEYPISIGTSLAIETLKPGSQYGSLWINLRTLFRNIWDALEGEDRKLILSGVSGGLRTPNGKSVISALADTLEEELHRLWQVTEGRIDKITLYHREYGDILGRFPHSILLVPNTPLQKLNRSIMVETIDEVLRRRIGLSIDVDRGSQLKGEPVKALIMTNYPVDLLSRTAFVKLRLIESYTGAIKTRSQWNTKLTDGKLMPRIPFNDFTIQVFGDGNVLFRAYPKKVRVAILELAEKYKWTTMTTKEKIRQNLAWMNDRYAAEQLKRLL